MVINTNKNRYIEIFQGKSLYHFNAGSRTIRFFVQINEEYCQFCDFFCFKIDTKKLWKSGVIFSLKSIMLVILSKNTK